MKAEEIKRLPAADWQGEARLYKLSRPVPAGWDWDEDETETTRYVVVSANIVLGKPETYIFASDENGEITDWCEMPGSFKGGLDHQEAIDGLLEKFGGPA